MSPASALPLTKLVLLNSGVGYFEHEGVVTGDAEFELPFHPEDVNDVLKSLVLQDLDGGTIGTVTYPLEPAAEGRPAGFDVHLTDRPTLAELLDQLRGESVRIVAADTIEGKILGVEQRHRTVEDSETLTDEVLHVLTDQGFRRISLRGVATVKLLNEKLAAQLDEALTATAEAHREDQFPVHIHFRGTGQRRVRIGYNRSPPTAVAWIPTTD